MASPFGDIGAYLRATFGEIREHPWQAAGAALGVPGWDPAIGGTFNNRPGGALLSPTGNFTSSAWKDMYQNNPDAKDSLDTFHRLNSVADVIAPMIAGGGASGGFTGGRGSGAGATGIRGFFSGPAAYGDSGLTSVVSPNGSGLAGVMSGDLGDSLGTSLPGLFSGLLPGGGMSASSSGALGGGISGAAAGASPVGGASMGGFNAGALAQIAQQLLQQQSNQRRQAAENQNSVAPQLSRLSPPSATLLPFQPTSVTSTHGLTPSQQLYAARLAQYGAY